MNANMMIEKFIAENPGSMMVRRKKVNFIAVPVTNEDGTTTYLSVRIGALLAEDTKNNTAFNFAEARAEYEEYEAAKAAAKEAAKNKPSTKREPDPVKAAEKKARQDTIVAWLINNPGKHTATEIFEALPDVYAGKMLMAVGSDAKPLVEAGQIGCAREKSKNFYYFGELDEE